jgi:hypothetical protein
MPISSLGTYYAALSGAAFTGPVSMSSTLTTNGAVTITAGGITVTGTTSTVNGALAVTGPLSGALTNYLSGMILSNDGSTPNTVLDISAGQCADSTNATVVVLPAFTKSTGGAWASGSGSNGMGNGLTIANSTWYHVFAILNGGNPDVYFDTSVTAGNAPTGTTASRRIGSFLTDGSAHIIPFNQAGDLFTWKTPVLDVNAATPTSGAQNAVTISVPTGVIVTAQMNLSASYASGGGTTLFVYPTFLSATPALAVVKAFVAGTSNAGVVQCLTNNASKVSVKLTYGGSTTYSLETTGWLDQRGRLG